jgi:hypothetical protein
VEASEKEREREKRKDKGRGERGERKKERKEGRKREKIVLYKWVCMLRGLWRGGRGKVNDRD